MTITQKVGKFICYDPRLHFKNSISDLNTTPLIFLPSHQVRMYIVENFGIIPQSSLLSFDAAFQTRSLPLCGNIKTRFVNFASHSTPQWKSHLCIPRKGIREFSILFLYRETSWLRNIEVLLYKNDLVRSLIFLFSYLPTYVKRI